MNRESLVSTHDLRPSERRFVTAMQQLGYGRFESLRIRHGDLVLDPWPTIVRSVKFGDATPNKPDNQSGEFELKQQTAQLLAFVRSVDAGEIRVIEVRGGLPFTMELPLIPDP
jgi:hypothetical protein